LIKNLVDSIYVLNERIVNIAASTEEISAQSDTICSISDEIKATVSEL
jgi:methyl-accepting chemotaxis protein